MFSPSLQYISICEFLCFRSSFHPPKRKEDYSSLILSYNNAEQRVHLSPFYPFQETQREGLYCNLGMEICIRYARSYKPPTTLSNANMQSN
mmetsp:Transcript_40865/g.98557  ORF Transcript_40865/g.98557 Transcript_40865/m.98557 type:complete len:91 (-) Transcript_40865:2760-3032(-)